MNSTLQKYKDSQREGWAQFGPLEAITLVPAWHLVEFSQVKSGHKVLDVGCGTGVVAVTAALRGAHVQALDLCPALLDQAHKNAALAQVEIEFQEGDVEELPFNDNSFDVVLSQFGHMFAPRPEVALRQMLRVLRPGGIIAFSTWPTELYTAQMFALVSKYMPAPAEIAAPTLWGDPNVIKQRFGQSVSDIVFDRQVMLSPSLSVQHSIAKSEVTAAPLIKLREKYEVEDPKVLENFRREYAALISLYRKGNLIHQHYLMTRAIKR